MGRNQVVNVVTRAYILFIIVTSDLLIALLYNRIGNDQMCF